MPLLSQPADYTEMDQRFWNKHPHLAWAMWGLDEIEATLASIEGRIRARVDVHPAATGAVADMRIARDALHKSITENGQTNPPVVASTKAALERQWTAFEDSVQDYLQAVGRQVTEQEFVFRARADAQSKAWQQAIDKVHGIAGTLAADRRRDIEAAVKRLELEADTAKAKLDALNKSEGASWAAMKSALTETRAALDRAHRAVLEAFERAA